MSSGSKGNAGGNANQSNGGGDGARRKQRRRPQNRPRPVDLWRAVPQLPDPEPIMAASDPGILLRSLGPPPLHGLGTQAENAFELVIRRSALMASALAAAAGLLADPNADPER